MPDLECNVTQFSSERWRIRPAILRAKDLPCSLISPDEAFAKVVRICNKMEAGGYKLYINGVRRENDNSLEIPQHRDCTISQYYERLCKDQGAHSFLIYSFTELKDDEDLMHRQDKFINALIGTGKPPAGSKLFELFAGKYQSTDGGIHKEKCANFHLVLSGEKTIRVWPEQTWDPKTEDILFKGDETTDYDEYYLRRIAVTEKPEHAIDLTGKAGDVLYWPAGWWHIGISPNLTMSSTIAMYD